MQNGTGIHPPTPFGDFDVFLGGDVAAQTVQHQMLRDLDQKVDDIRGSVASMSVSQAITAGDVKVLATKLDGFEEGVDRRIGALEAVKSRDEWQAWAERLAAAIIGGGALEVARRWLG